MITAIAILLSGCAKNIKDDVKDLQSRVTSLESAIKSLEQKLAQGALIKSVTPLADNAGWKLEFTSGSPSSIEIKNGTAGVTPQLEVRNNADGSTSLWVNTGAGWTNTGVNLRGPTGATGNTGATGAAGAAGADGISPKIEVRDNGGGNFSIWYNITAGYPPAGWVDTGENLAAIGPILSVVDNAAAGTVTITMNDGVPTAYEFPKASTAVRIEVMNPFKVEIEEGDEGTIVFRVNPSTAWVPTGMGAAIANWELDQIMTRTGYVTAPTDFSLVSILPDAAGAGQYIATISCDNFDAAITDYVMALVLNTNTAADPVLVSSSTFTVGSPPFFYNIGDIAAINDLIATNGLGWNPTLPADGSTVDPSWTGVTWGGPASDKRIVYLNLRNQGLTGSADLTALTALESLNCYGNSLTDLDVSGLTALKFLDCGSNMLTDLDVSDCTALALLYCDINNLNDTALDAIFNALFDRSALSDGDIYITGNPGAPNNGGGANISIATGKNWVVHD